MCDEHAGSLQLEQWYSTSSVTQSTVPSQDRYDHNISADSDVQMYNAHYLGECRIGTCMTTIFAYVRSHYKGESPRQRCGLNLESQPTAQYILGNSMKTKHQLIHICTCIHTNYSSLVMSINEPSPGRIIRTFQVIY